MTRFICAVLVAAVCTLPASATTYLPVTFEQLVQRADLIFVGRVVDVRAFAVTNGRNTAIKTRVVFDVAESLLGAGTTETLEFLGGEVGGVELAVAGMPRFQRGDRRLVFASRGPSINPIVGFTQGLMQIAPDQGGVERVLAVNPLAPGLPITLADMRVRIRTAIAQTRRQ